MLLINRDLQELEGERKQLAEQKTELERQLFEKRGKLENARKDKTDKEELLKEREKDIRQSRWEGVGQWEEFYTVICFVLFFCQV